MFVLRCSDDAHVVTSANRFCIPQNIVTPGCYRVNYTEENFVDAVGDGLGVWKEYSQHKLIYYVDKASSKIKNC